MTGASVRTPATFQTKKRSFSHNSLRNLLRDAIRVLQVPKSNPQKCGSVRWSDGVRVRFKNGFSYLHGLVHCGRPWACPVCAYRIARGRGEELQEIIRRHRKLGGDVLHLTATTPHDSRYWLKVSLGVVSGSWRKGCVSGGAWVKIKKALGIQGWCRALEVTHGAHGWHPHIHVLLFLDHPLSKAQRDVLEAYFREHWADAVFAAGYRRPSREHGVRLSDGKGAGWYVTKITKQGLAQEIARSDTKKGRAGNRSPLQIMEDYRRHHLECDRKLIVEWLTDTYRVPQLTWSNGFRKQLAQRYQVAEQLDLDIAQDIKHPADELLGEISGAQWDRLVDLAPSFPGQVVEAAEKGGWPAVERLIWRTSAGAQKIPP
ncbi:unnamed protein product [marine sediment metagenome]|uniref:Replication protein n=1 Tax=marine sediment metagenome TaxID=412755 RepID=X1JF93_9ZZZZ